VVRADSGGSHAGYGARLSIPLKSFASGSLGAAVFGGVGVTTIDVATTDAGTAATKSVTLSSFPIGLAFGFRHALGATRGISAYVAPFYMLARQTGDTSLKATGGAIRASLGLDVTLAPQIGLTLGYEAGAKAKAGTPGPQGGVFGVGISYALRRQ
jgi:hypothetical protein